MILKSVCLFPGKTDDAAFLSDVKDMLVPWSELEAEGVIMSVPTKVSVTGT